MAVHEEPAEGSISSILLKSLTNTQTGDAFSKEDIAWADSCLVKDLEISVDDWSSIKDALLDGLSLIPESQDTSGGAMNNDGSVGGTDDVPMLLPDDNVIIEQPSSSSDDHYRVTIGGEPNLDINTMLSKEEMDVLYSLQFLVQDPETFNGDWNSMQDAVEQILSLRPKQSDDMMTVHGVEDAQSSTGTDRDFDEETKMKAQHADRDTAESFQVDSLRSTYKNDNPQEPEQSDLPVDTSSSGEDAGVTTSEIFKLWDLGISAKEEEEDEFIKKLNKALADSSIQSIAPVVDDSEATRDLKEGALVYLIAGIGDLSIQQHSG